MFFYVSDHLSRGLILVGVRPTINKDLNGAQLHTLSGIAPISSSILHNKVLYDDCLIVVTRVEQIHTRFNACWAISEIQPYLGATACVFEPHGVGRDWGGCWQLAGKVDGFAYISLDCVDDWRCGEAKRATQEVKGREEGGRGGRGLIFIKIHVALFLFAYFFLTIYSDSVRP